VYQVRPSKQVAACGCASDTPTLNISRRPARANETRNREPRRSAKQVIGDRHAGIDTFCVGTLECEALCLPAATAFVDPASNWRLPAGSPLRRAGSSYDAFVDNCKAANPNCAWATIYNIDSPSIVGRPRPSRGAFDTGAW
jgi:hypothetical protein